jgi:hypothetical protein
VERCFFDAIEMKKHPPEKKLKAIVDQRSALAAVYVRWCATPVLLP